MTKIAFMVTGFSSFSGVVANPTERLATWLRVNVQEGNLVIGPGLEVRDVAVLKVAAKDVDAYFTQLAHQLEQAAAQGVVQAAADSPPDATAAAQPQPRHVVLLHLGVATDATEYRLESSAQNCANFRVPDERGWCPQMEEIEPGRGTGSCMGSCLPLGTVCERLAAGGHNVVVSEDAGQFVCNWTYYRACRMAERYGGMQAVFVHVPPLEVADEAKQRAFLLDVMRAIAGCISSSEVAPNEEIGSA